MHILKVKLLFQSHNQKELKRKGAKLGSFLGIQLQSVKQQSQMPKTMQWKLILIKPFQTRQKSEQVL